MSRNMRQQDGGHGAPVMRRKANAASSLLTQEENEAVFRMVGEKCQTLNTAVVQIYKTEASAHSHWKKKHTGVVCFVKDWDLRSYFLRAYCLIKHELIWEHELYDAMKINKARSFLLTFEGQDGHIALNFVSEDECDSFYRAVDKTIETRNQKRNKRKSQMAPSAPLAPLPKEPDSNTVQLRNNASKIGTINFTPAPAPVQQPTSKHLFSSLSSSSNNKKQKGKFNKCDIGAPTNFRHVSHVGWDDDKGFDCQGDENDEVLTQFFAKAGVSKHQLSDRDTRAFIYDFIQNKNVLDIVKQENVEKPKTTLAAPPPPPPPTRHHHHAQNGNTTTTTTTATTTPSAPRSAPPPPARQPPPPVPTTVPGLSRAPAPPSRPPPPPAPSTAPPPPPPPPAASFAPPPPPPPPAMGEVPSITTTHVKTETKAPSSLPPISDTRNELMDSIRKGVQLKKVDTSALSTGSGDSHGDLMSEIRMGFELKPASSREIPSSRANDEPVSGTDALADALRRALLDRGRVMQSSDDESESSGNDDEWDD